MSLPEAAGILGRHDGPGIVSLIARTVYGTLYHERFIVDDELKKMPVRFYRSETGAEPVREWLRDLDRKDRLAIGADVATVEYGWPLGMPTCRPLGAGLWEVRSDLATNRIARVLFCEVSGQMILLHGFMKKSRKTPNSDLALARARQKEVDDDKSPYRQHVR